MKMLCMLLAVTAAACAIARSTGPTAASEVSQLVPPRDQKSAPLSPTRQYLNDYILPGFMMPRYLGYEESPQILPARNLEDNWLSKEIDRINEMEEADESPNSYEMELIPRDSDGPRLYDVPMVMRDVQAYLRETLRASTYNMQSLPPNRNAFTESMHTKENYKPKETVVQHEENIKSFALTPLDKGYYQPAEKVKTQKPGGPHEGGESEDVEFEPPRQIRQNPNLSRARALVTEELDRLKTRVPNKDYRLPVSLLPTNLRWLKLNYPQDVEESTPGDVDYTKKLHNDVAKSQVLDSVSDPADSIYGVALIAAVGSALAMIIVGFAFGWYTLSKKAKAAADVDYPAYGVTGPTVDMSGDRKLAHSAHMYHYQHQKQQIIAMERSGLEQGNGSVSDPESEEENEEGDYTVYECPGFATTGDMEVRNPLFSENPTPATPGKCELVKPQPKE